MPLFYTYKSAIDISLLTTLSLIFIISLDAQTVTYTESTEDFANPDRGFYSYTETYASNYTPLDVNDLISKRTNFFTPSGANYMVRTTVFFRYYILDDFYQNATISNDFLTKMEADFSIARQAGVRLIIRFTYNINPDTSCGQAACPPYKDATKAIIISHLNQLKPYLQANSDVIAAVQSGFIGVWGEQYYTDHFGDASPSGAGKINNTNWQDRNEVLAKVLEAVPSNRMVQVRYPQLKQKLVYGVNAPVTSLPIMANQAFMNTNIARIGFHNDCFLASPDDYGTYFDYGSDNTSPSNQIDILKPYFAADGKYTAVGGETCNDGDFSPQNDCTGQAVSDMASLHYSYLNAQYNNEVNNDWVTGGCMDEIKRKLGYRFVMRNGTYPSEVNAGTTLNFSLNLDNIGFAAPFNERNLQLVLRNSSTNNEQKIPINGTNTDVRFWHTGTINLVGNVQIPSNLPLGNYKLLLHILDPSENNRIANRPEYSIRLANQNTWETNTGFNDLNHIVTINAAGSCTSNNLGLSGPLNSNQNYETDATISSTQQISGNTVVTYDAKIAITLNSGFSVANGVTFNALIDGCNAANIMEKNIENRKTNFTKLNSKPEIAAPSISVFPNPFKEAFNINYTLSEAGNYSLILYNMLGEKVKQSLNGTWLEKGVYNITITATNLPKGAYFLLLKSNNQSVMKKLITQ